MIDCDQASYLLIQVFQFLQFWSAGNCWFDLQQWKSNQDDTVKHFILFLSKAFWWECYIPSIIYRMNLWSRLIDFIAQTPQITILFQFAIQISELASIIIYGDMMVTWKSGIFLSKTLICGECSQTWLDVCFADMMGLSAPGLNPCVPPGGVRGIEFCGACRWRNQQWRRRRRFPFCALWR